MSILSSPHTQAMTCLREAENHLMAGSIKAAREELGNAIRLAGQVTGRDRARLDDLIDATSANIAEGGWPS